MAILKELLHYLENTEFETLNWWQIGMIVTIKSFIQLQDKLIKKYDAEWGIIKSDDKQIWRWTPDRPEETRAGVWGAQPPSGFGFWDPARRPGPGPPALPGITRPGSKKGYRLGFGLKK